jgi:hypothetical protein
MPPRLSSPQALLCFAAALLTAAALLPLLLADIPPLVDYLNHIARDYILAHYDESASYRQYYRPAWAFLPNLAMDLWVVPLAKIISVDLAGKLFIGAILILTVAGVFFLSKTLHGQIEIPALLVFFLVYHRLLLWGYLNFSFGIALALLGFSLWLRLRDSPGWLRLAVFGGFGTLVLLCHLFAFGVYLLLIGGHHLGRSVATGPRGFGRRGIREWLVVALVAAIPAALFLALSPTVGKSGEIRFGTLLGKLTPAFHVVNHYHRGLDYATFFLLAGAIALGLWRGRLSLARPVWWPLGLGAALQLAMPETLFGSQTADARLPVVLWLLLAAGLRLHGVEVRRWRPVLLGFLALALVRLGIVAYEWQRANAVYREYLAAFEAIEPGARLLSAIALPRHPSFHHPPLTFIASRAVIARATFDPFLFADLGHQPLNFAEPYRTLAKLTPGPVVYYPENSSNQALKLADWQNPFRDEVLRHYDYLLLIEPRRFGGWVPARLETVSAGTNFRLYRIPPVLAK